MSYDTLRAILLSEKLADVDHCVPGIAGLRKTPKEIPTGDVVFDSEARVAGHEPVPRLRVKALTKIYQERLTS